jgi:glycosyltransferase involved in cell wall biosynthesis
LVSVVVPVFNGLPHLVDLTASILAQTHTNLEIVFAEGGSSDQSPEFLATITDPRVQILTMPKGTTAAQNWTAACEAATGTFIKLICQDDLINPDAIQKQLADLLNNPTAVMAIAQRDIIDANGKVLYANRGLSGLKKELLPGAEVIRTAYVTGTNVIGEPLAVLFRTDALLAAMPWDDSNPLMLDLSTYAKVAPKGDVVTRNESVGSFRVSGSSWSTRLAKLQLEQTKLWQHAYAADASPAPSHLERTKAAFGRHLQTGLRRAAYAMLRARGSFRTTAD